VSRIRAPPTRLEQVIFTFATIHGTGVLSSILIKIEGRTGLLRAGDGESSCFSCLEPIAAVAANPGALGFPTAAHCTSILGGAQVEAAWPRRCRNSAQGTSKSPRGCARHQAPGGQNGDCFRFSSEANADALRKQADAKGPATKAWRSYVHAPVGKTLFAHALIAMKGAIHEATHRRF
jgi:hypothetical protein